MEPSTKPRLLSRRQALTASLITGAGAASMAPVREGGHAVAQTPSRATCLLTPQATEGPYYFDPKLVRANITEGRPGLPLRLVLEALDESCRPLTGARVDIWHCDAQGEYSGFGASAGSKPFMRGTQITGADGLATFITIFPGWYPGRTNHIHFKIFLDEKSVLTSQLYFPDALNEYIYTNVPEYRRAETRDTLNINDSIVQTAGSAVCAEVREEADTYVAHLTIGVDPTGRARSGRAGPGRRGGSDGPFSGEARVRALTPR